MESIKNITIENFLSEALIVDPLEPISKIVGIMKEKEAYEVFSIMGDKIGAVTIRDLLKAKNFKDTRTESFLNSMPKLDPSTNLFQAAKIMADYRLRSLPVVNLKDKVIGKLDVKAIVNKVKETRLGAVSASKIMTPLPISFSSGEKIGKAKRIMIRRRLDHLPVLKDRKIGGIVTSSQIVFNLIPTPKGRSSLEDSEEFRPLDLPVDAIMDTNPLRCSPEDSIRGIADTMLEQKLSCCLVTIGEELQGIITYRDFAKLISEGEQKSEVPAYMVGLPDDPFEAEAAKIKFQRLVELVSRTHKPLIEARSTIKTSGSRGPRTRYEVSVSIRTPKETHNYTSNGWELPAVFDDLTSKIKKVLPDKERRIRRERGIKKSEIPY